MFDGLTSDTVSLWVNPTLPSGSEPAADVVIDNQGGTNVTSANGIQFLGLRASSAGQHGNIEIDEIRVTTTWPEAVVPVELSDFRAD